MAEIKGYGPQGSVKKKGGGNVLVPRGSVTGSTTGSGPDVSGGAGESRANGLKGISEDELKSIVTAELSLSESSRQVYLSKATKALEYFQGDMRDIVAEKGRSGAVSLDLADTMGWILPGVIRVFTASQHMAIVEPAGNEDVEWAENATDGVNYTFWKENDGYRVIHSATWDSLLAGNGIVKTWYDDTPVKKVSFHSGLDDIDLARLVAGDDVRVLEHSEYQVAIPSPGPGQPTGKGGLRIAPPQQPMAPPGLEPPPAQPSPAGSMVAPQAGPPAQMGSPQLPQGPMPGQIGNEQGLQGEQFPVMPPDQPPQYPSAASAPSAPSATPPQMITVHDVKIERTKSYGCIKIECIAPEDYGKNDEAKTCDEARFQYHRARKTRSELIEMGFDRQTVEDLGRATEWDTPQEIARNRYAHDWQGDQSTEIVDLYECYLKVDINDDGIAETVKINYAGHKSGGEILDWEEWEDETPFDDVPCNPMPHRWEAGAISDETMDVQQIKTVLIRQGLDNTYATSNPQRFVTGNIKNPDALFSPVFGETIFGEPGSNIVAMPVPFVSDKIFDAIAYQDQVIERRTGVSKTTMALDPEALQNQTATAVQAGRDAAYSQIELIARNQAELGWKKIFKKILLLEIKHRDIPRQIRMGGKPVTVDPRHWNADMDVSINVGLGTGSRDRDMQILNQVKQDLMTLASAAAQQGYAEVAVQVLPYLLKTMHKFGESSGLHNPELFYPEIGDEDVLAMQAQIAQQKGQPDPKVQGDQMKAQMDGQKLQADMQLAQQKMQFDMQMEQQKAQAALLKERAQMEADQQVAATQAAFKERELAQHFQIEQAKLAQQRELELLKLGLQSDGVTPAATSGIGLNSEVIMATLQQLLQGITHISTAPKRIVRDPKTGKAVGVETLPVQKIAQPQGPVSPADQILHSLSEITGAPKKVIRHPDTGKVIGLETMAPQTNGKAN